jgi:hypothetical protein
MDEDGKDQPQTEVTEMVTVSSFILSPIYETGGALSQAPDPFVETPSSLAFEIGSVALCRRELKLPLPEACPRHSDGYRMDCKAEIEEWLSSKSLKRLRCQQLGCCGDKVEGSA